MRRLFRGAFLLLDVLLLVFFLAGYAARYIPPYHVWWTELVAIGLPYLSLLLLVATAGVALARRWRLLALHVVLLLLAAVRFIPFGYLFHAAQPGGEDLTVMSYNVPPWWGFPTEKEKARKMVELIRDEQPDLLVLQEARLGHRPRRPGLRGARYVTALVDSLGYAFIPLEVGRLATEQPVLSRFEQREQTETVFRVGSADDDVTRVVRARFTWQGREAVLYNLHLRTFGPEKPWQDDDMHPLRPRLLLPYLRQYRAAFLARAREAEQIRRLLEQETLPVIVCGDLNSTPHNWAFRRLAEGLKLQDVFKLAGRGWGATYHTRLPFVRIDFVLASPEWEVVSARVLDARLSDHLPVVATLRWREEY